ncbi:hypothetical protein L596_024463 [Steinernema carpocapsae]|uniref:Tc1-like transposase DDE domain-containing protein n=1 Tax=Steinernema carpocapsae TaxID=34508 RepID=A0A4U5MGU5_STECR|nr:hypothetical protein L596_024463 [Steinernema carpocapsae]
MDLIARINLVRFYVDTKLRENGIFVLRLPPYHANLNAIEPIWAHVKNNVRKNVSHRDKLPVVVALTENAFSSISQNHVPCTITSTEKMKATSNSTPSVFWRIHGKTWTPTPSCSTNCVFVR